MNNEQRTMNNYLSEDERELLIAYCSLLIEATEGSAL